MRVRLVHEALSGGRLHAYRSPDVKGLYATSETIAGAKSEARRLVGAIFTLRNEPLPGIAFDDEPGVSYEATLDGVRFLDPATPGMRR